MRDFEDTFRNRISTFSSRWPQGVAPEAIDGSAPTAWRRRRCSPAAIESLENETVVYVR